MLYDKSQAIPVVTDPHSATLYYRGKHADERSIFPRQHSSCDDGSSAWARTPTRNVGMPEVINTFLDRVDVSGTSIMYRRIYQGCSACLKRADLATLEEWRERH